MDEGYAYYVESRIVCIDYLTETTAIHSHRIVVALSTTFLIHRFIYIHRTMPNAACTAITCHVAVHH